jgi:glycoside/pentoside/hexuronide:cation symporter, GPH family
MKPMPLQAVLSYGLLGLPLAMVALPIYVFIPQFYSQRAGLSLSLIGAVLLAARIMDAFIDPLLGWWIERGGNAYARYVLAALPLLLAGFAALFHPPALAGAPALAWFLGSLMLVYLGFSLATIAHQSWGAALTYACAPDQRARVTAVREGCGLVGVILAAALAGALGWLTLAFCLTLLASAALLLLAAPRPLPVTAVFRAGAAPRGIFEGMFTPLRDARFRALFAVLMVNGIGAAIPATLFLFFTEDRLRLGQFSGAFLVLYFGAAALSMPLWVALARRFGEARSWVAGMLLSALVFVWAYWLGAGAVLGFGAICLLSGLTLGADLALPPALLAGVIGQAGHGGQREAAYFGLWNWGVQLTLALAAGIALPLLGWLGYVPGGQAGTGALAASYALLPCALKLMAAAMLWRAPLRNC